MDRRNLYRRNLIFCDCLEFREMILTRFNRYKDCPDKWLNFENIRTNGRWDEFYVSFSWNKP